ncbi:MAG: hypothetical protein K8R53_01095 [Bacteroidales bacterium]|nr:hypothetical protein [Bacteroidales bacterium]
MKKLISLLSLVFIVTILTTSCSKENEVVIEPGYLNVTNNSDMVFSVYIENVENGQELTYVGKVNEFGKLDIQLEMGYTYEVTAIEDVQGEPNTLSKRFLVYPHKSLTWTIPSKANN